MERCGHFCYMNESSQLEWRLSERKKRSTSRLILPGRRWKMQILPGFDATHVVSYEIHVPDCVSQTSHLDRKDARGDLGNSYYDDATE